MKATLLAVGRARGGPEADFVADRLKRFDRAARPLGLGPARLVEIDDRRARGPDAEAERLLSALHDGAALVALDERGRAMTSPDFAAWIADRRDAGIRELALAVGGPDGHGEALRARADLSLSFGAMVWPHMLARAMAAEQLYRAASILAGSPYHRD